MEVTIQKTAAIFMAKAMAMPPPPPSMSLARKRSLNEMSHSRPDTTFLAPPPAPLSLVRTKKTKSTLASSAFTFPVDDEFSIESCRVCEDASVSMPRMDGLSAEAQQFLADDPFDFDALPHPVLQRQQAVLNVCEYYPTPIEDAEMNDDLMGLELGDAPSVVPSLMPRWTKSVVATSLANMGRNPNALTLSSRSM